MTDSNEKPVTEKQDEKPALEKAEEPFAEKRDEEPVTESTTSEATKSRVADRPHCMTILLGLLSPTLAVIALFASLQSIRISRDSLHIGQRAYLQAAFYFHENRSGTSESDSAKVPKPEKSVQYPFWTFGLKFTNTGNTPAYVSDVVFSPEYDEPCLDRGGIVHRAVNGATASRMDRTTGAGKPLGRCLYLFYHSDLETTVGGKESDCREYGELSQSGMDAADALARRHSYFLPNIAASFDYRDVFGETYHEKVTCLIEYSNHEFRQIQCRVLGG